jgi:hypothetical protein
MSMRVLSASPWMSSEVGRERYQAERPKIATTISPTTTAGPRPPGFTGCGSSAGRVTGFASDGLISGTGFSAASGTPARLAGSVGFAGDSAVVGSC